MNLGQEQQWRCCSATPNGMRGTIDDLTRARPSQELPQEAAAVPGFLSGVLTWY
jgi:hypothetical protein